MKKLFITLLSISVFTSCQVQKFSKTPESKIKDALIEKHIRFLASDELLGRKTGEQGNNAAARYIAEEWRSYGLLPVNEESYFQTMILKDSLKSQNVIGVIPGTDPVLKNEYVILSAHFDHLGYNKSHENGEDFIFNGARDNGIGVAGLLVAAQTLAAKPAKRSVLLIAYTGEEMGLLGSKYYAKNPLVALNKTVFNLNIDGAGYNDTSIISAIGVPRTGAEIEITTAVEAVGLRLLNDPVPELGLFDRSDNVSLAVKGIPAPTFTPGFTSFDGEIAKYYHKEADNPESLDFVYCTQFCKAYAYAARLIANKKTAPKWEVGDKYYDAGKQLYGE